MKVEVQPECVRALTRYGYVSALVVFLLSGVSGLVYEVLWTRNLALVLGSSTLASSVVLAVFLAGLSAGSALAGRRSLKMRSPLRVYAWLELGIGIYVACMPLLLLAGDYLHSRLYEFLFESWGLTILVDVAVSALVMFPPTVALGLEL